VENLRGNTSISISGTACSLDICIAYKLFPHNLVEITQDKMHIYFLAPADPIKIYFKIAVCIFFLNLRNMLFLEMVL